MPDIQPPQSIHEVPIAIFKNMVALATSGFGVVVALAWNDAIKKVVTDFIDPYLGKNGSMISLFIYAVVVTLLAVFVTMQLSALQRKFELLNENVALRRKQRAKALEKAKADTTSSKTRKTTKRK